MIRVCPDYETLSEAAAEHIRSVGVEAVRERGRFDLVLSGGQTPRRAYDILAERTANDRSLWENTHVFWGDERCVPMNDPESNYLTGKRALLEPARIPRANVHPITARPPDEEAVAESYAQVFPEAPDLLILGMGVDGHTASLFPRSALLDESRKRFAFCLAPIEPKERITMTPGVIASARNVLVLVSGAEKAPALRRVFAPQGDLHETPARLLRHATWLVDGAAARELG